MILLIQKREFNLIYLLFFLSLENKSNLLQNKNSSLKSNRILNANSVMNNSDLIKYEDFIKKYNEKNRCLEKRDIIVY
jgi:hypothetical protein